MEYDGRFHKVPETIKDVISRARDMAESIVYTLRQSRDENECFPDFEERMSERIAQFRRTQESMKAQIVDREDSDVIG